MHLSEDFQEILSTLEVDSESEALVAEKLKPQPPETHAHLRGAPLLGLSLPPGGGVGPWSTGSVRACGPPNSLLRAQMMACLWPLQNSQQVSQCC